MPTPIVLFTGGSRGLGRNMAQHLAEHGSDIILTYRSEAGEAQAVVAAIEAHGRRAVALPLDVGDSAGFPAFVERVRAVLAGWGVERFDALVNNAGMGVHAPFADTTEAQFDQLVNVHL